MEIIRDLKTNRFIWPLSKDKDTGITKCRYFEVYVDEVDNSYILPKHNIFIGEHLMSKLCSNTSDRFYYRDYKNYHNGVTSSFLHDIHIAYESMEPTKTSCSLLWTERK